MSLRHNARRPSHHVMRLVVGAMLCLTVAGCGDDGVSPPQQLAFGRALALWNSQGLDHYTVEARISCFCAPGLHYWHELTVANDTVTAVRLVEDLGSEIPPPFEVEPSFYDSVSELFERIQRTLQQTDGWRVEATYDQTSGMPLEVNVIAPPGLADGGATYYLRALKPALIN